MLFIATSNWLYLAGGLGSGCAAAMLAYKLFSHVRNPRGSMAGSVE